MNPKIKENNIKMDKRNYFSGNKDTDTQILLKLSYGDISKVGLVNKYLLDLCKSDNFWRNKLKEDFPLRSKYLYYKEYKQLFLENPKKLYEIINSKSKIITIKSMNSYSSTENIINDMEERDEELTIRNIMENILNSFRREEIEALPLLRGDVIYFEWVSDYNNDGKLVWDGEKLIQLNYESVGYDSILEYFPFPEFSPDHFSENLDYSDYSSIYLIPEKIKEIIDNFDVKTQTSFLTNKYNKYLVKFLLPMDYIDIKFKNIYIDGNILNFYQNEFKYIIGMDSSLKYRYGKMVGVTIKFSSKWKESILKITSLYPYNWEGNYLTIIYE